MEALLAPLLPLVDACAFLALGGPGALAFELPVVLEATLLGRLPDGFFAGTHLRFAKCGARRCPLLPRLAGLAVARGPLDVALVHQQPSAKTVRAGPTEPGNEPGGQRGRDA